MVYVAHVLKNVVFSDDCGLIRSTVIQKTFHAKGDASISARVGSLAMNLSRRITPYLYGRNVFSRPIGR